MGSWRFVVAVLCFACAASVALADPPDRHVDGPKDEDREPEGLSGHLRSEASVEAEALLLDSLELDLAARKPPDGKAPDPSKLLAEVLGEGAGLPDVREQLKAAKGVLHQGLEAEAAEAPIEQDLAAWQARAEETRERVWKQWQNMVAERDVDEAAASREFEKHAKREAKLLRIETLASEAGDKDALDRVRKLLRQEAQRTGKHMQQLVRESEPAAKDSAK